MAGAHRKIDPPANVPLDAGDKPFFHNIIEEFAKADWTPHQLEMAALLARSMNDFAVEQMLMRDEGAVVQGEKGLSANPRKQVMHMHAQNIIAFRRSLAMHATANGRMINDIAKRHIISHQIQAQAPSLSDELIAQH